MPPAPRELLAAVLLVGCVGSAAAPAPEHDEPVVRTADDGALPVTWSIPEDQQPPRLDGAAQVLTSVALGDFSAQVGRYLETSPAVYEGTLQLDGGEVTPVMATSLEQPSVYLDGISLTDGVYTLDLHAGEQRPRTRVWQDAGWPGWANFAPEDLPPDGLVSGFLEVPAAEAGASLRGRCFSCLTVLRDEPVDAVVIRATDIDPEQAASVAYAVDAELTRITPEAITPAVLGRLWTAFGDADGSARADELVEVRPDVFEREQIGQSYLRCKLGGSRLVDFRVTWRLAPGEPDHSGIRALEVYGAAECESFDYGGGS